MITIKFESIEQAIEYGKQNGGWIWQAHSEDTATWYDPGKFTMGYILENTEGSGFVGNWREHDEIQKEVTKW